MGRHPPVNEVCFIIVSFNNEVMFSSLVIIKQDYAKNTQPVFTKFREKVDHGPVKK